LRFSKSHIPENGTAFLRYNESSINQMKYLDCPLKYIRKTGRPFGIRYREYIQGIKNNNNGSGYSLHMYIDI
jgi:hypothetical protein